jgi:hypothetical protein
MPYKPTGRPNGRPPKLPPWHRRAINVELAYVVPGLEPWPSTASVGEVAAAAGVTRRAVRERRKCPLYRAELLRRFERLLAKQLEADHAAEQPPSAPPSWWSEWTRKTWKEIDNATRAEWVKVWVERNWTGPTRSPLDGEVYDTREAYIAHLLAAGIAEGAGPYPYDDLTDSI